MTGRALPLLGRRLDLPLERDGSGRFLPWIIAVMVFLAALSLAGTIALSAAVARWDWALAATLTVQLPADAGAAAGRVVAMLRATPGVDAARLLDAKESAALVEPWLGSAAVEDVPLPLLIDLRVDPAAPPDRGQIAEHLHALAPGGRLADNRAWLAPLRRAAFGVELVAAGIVAILAGAAILSIVFAARTGLAIHHGTVEVLHLIGAQDRYIARQFSWQALRLGLRGGVIGLAGAALTLLALERAGADRLPYGPDISALPHLALGAGGWCALLLLLPAAGLTALLTARITVMRALRRMP